jgi:pimeloyl-ACP methyl ester carboxylesterase
MRRHLLRSRRQLRRSWYIFFFQIPWWPERLLRRDDFSFGARSLRGTSRRGTFTDEALARYREAWGRPGALRSMLHWYRAAFRGALRPYGPTRVPVETLLIWGARDTALGREMAPPSIEMCDRGRLEYVEEATHWVQHEEPERVNALLLSHLAGERLSGEA